MPSARPWRKPRKTNSVSTVTQNAAKAGLIQNEQGGGPLSFILGYRLERPQRELV